MTNFSDLKATRIPLFFIPPRDANSRERQFFARSRVFVLVRDRGSFGGLFVLPCPHLVIFHSFQQCKKYRISRKLRKLSYTLFLHSPAYSWPQKCRKNKALKRRSLVKCPRSVWIRKQSVVVSTQNQARRLYCHSYILA